MFELNIYQQALVIGGLLCLIPIVAYVIGWLCYHVYAWLDDGKMPEETLVTKAIVKLWGLSYRSTDEKRARILGHRYRYGGKGDWQTDGCSPIFVTSVILGLLPIIIILILDFILAAAIVVGSITVAHLARMCFRHRKLFDKHIKDKDAHG